MGPIIRGFPTGARLGPGLRGPSYPASGFGKFAFGPVSRLPKLGTAGAVYGAYRAVHWIGTRLDNRLNLSGRLANAAFRKIGPPPKALVRLADRLGIR